MRKKIEKSNNCYKIVLTIILVVQVKITRWEVLNTPFQQKTTQEPFETYQFLKNIDNRRNLKILEENNKM